MQHNLAHVMADQLATLRAQKGNITLEDLGGVLEHLAGSLNDSASGVEVFLRDEIIKIANHIATTKSEVIALAPATLTAKGETAANQLDAVIKATEQAAHTIMDAADELQSTIAAANVEKAIKEKIEAITARMYEACNFQDITGQRITKVMQALEFTEARIRKLVSLFASDGSVNIVEFKKAIDTRPDAHLLNGPQLPGQAPSQHDIDALFGNSSQS